MESIGGCTLKSLVERHAQEGRRIAIECCVHITIECCRALAILDRDPPDIVPRDISPENILISKQGEVSFVRFDIAEVRRRVAAHSSGFSYISPETASGREYDRRTDVFELGIILWEMLTGGRLFVGETDYQTVELVREARVPAIAAKNPGVEPELEAIVRKALAQAPRDRYRSTAVLGDALAQYLAGRRIEVSTHSIAILVREMLEGVRRLPN